jgi:hypothetical protein
MRASNINATKVNFLDPASFVFIPPIIPATRAITPANKKNMKIMPAKGIKGKININSGELGSNVYEYRKKHGIPKKTRDISRLIFQFLIILNLLQ